VALAAQAVALTAFPLAVAAYALEDGLTVGRVVGAGTRLERLRVGRVALGCGRDLAEQAAARLGLPPNAAAGRDPGISYLLTLTPDALALGRGRAAQMPLVYVTGRLSACSMHPATASQPWQRLFANSRPARSLPAGNQVSGGYLPLAHGALSGTRKAGRVQ
jgi:hypothetical protein